MKKIFFIQLNLEDFDNGTCEMNFREFTIYTRLLFASYTKDLPDDDKKLARIARCNMSDIKKTREIIDKKFQKSEGFLKNLRTEIEIKKYTEKSKKRKHAAEERWKNQQSGDANASDLHCKNDALAIQMQCYLTPNNQHLNLIPNNEVIKTPTPTPNGLEFKKNGNLVGGVGKVWTKLDIIGKLQGSDIKKLQSVAPKWDIEYLAEVYIEGINNGKREPPNSVQKAFPKWCEKYTKGKPPDSY